MVNLAQDLKFGMRMLRRSPGFAAVAVVSLALGIGANTAIFSVMDALLLRSLPVKEPGRLVLVGEGRMCGLAIGFPDGPTDLYAFPFFKELRKNNRVFSEVAAIGSMSADVHGRIAGAGMELEPLKVRLVSGNYFSMLGVGAAMGRVLAPEDDTTPGGHPVAVLSHAFWTRRMGRDAGALGKTLSFGGTVYTVIGVAAPEFFGTVLDESPDLWIPLTMLKQAQPWIDEDVFGNPEVQTLWLMGRMKPGVTLAQAQASTNVVYQEWQHEAAGTVPSADRLAAMRKAKATLTPAARGISNLRREFSEPLKILMAVVGLVLLIACANVANLLLARAAGRRREIAVRLALGVSRGRLVRQLLSESMVLSLLGAALGVLFAWWGGPVLLAMVASGPAPVPMDVAPNAEALLFTLGLAIATGLLFGIAPALRMSGFEPGAALKERTEMGAGHSRSRLGQALVAGQVAMALFLMIGAGLFLRTLGKLERADVGFDKDRVVLVNLDTEASQWKGPALASLSQRIEARIRALPGVEAASFSMLNFGEGTWVRPVWPAGVERKDANAKIANGNLVGTSYFETLGMPMMAGRGFGPQDTPESQHAIVVNQTLAKMLYSTAGSPIGKHVWLLGEDKHDYEIVGVVRDAKFAQLRQKPRAMWFLSSGQERDAGGLNDLVVRVKGDPAALISQIRTVIRAEDPNVAVAKVATLSEMVERSLGQERLLAKLAGFFGGLALLLAAIGLYGVMAYAVARRTNEIGIRMALGAQRWAVLKMVMGESLTLVALGLAVGIPAALACGRLVEARLYGVAAGDAGTIAGAAAVLLAVAAAASYLPARRAARLDPLEALREE